MIKTNNIFEQALATCFLYPSTIYKIVGKKPVGRRKLRKKQFKKTFSDSSLLKSLSECLEMTGKNYVRERQ